MTPGTRIGPYQLVAKLGEGGMGEVYRGRDSKLDRDVALKILSPAVASDPDRIARFGREARLLASLNHPNIAHIHGFEDSSDTHALVMELVEGDTLQERLARGAIPVDEAMHLARQLTDALDAAHERGVIHRDLKPANIKVTPAGMVKVLDFGIAKAQEPPDGETQHSAMLTSAALTSRPGVILGTAAYMSPEQAKGAPVDKRTDIWAFGCVVFEMLTGRRLFAGDSMTDTLAAVMRDEIPIDQLPATTPPPLSRVVARCLERDPKRRLRDIGEARIAIDEAMAQPAAAQPRAAVASTNVSRLMRVMPWIVAGAAVAVAAFVWWRPGAAINRESLELEIGPPADTRFLIGTKSGNVLLSPDGAKIVFRAAKAGRDALWIRSLSRADAQPLTGTENAQYPFWAPDSRRLGFFAAGQLKTLDTAAGLPQVVTDAPSSRGGSWGDDDMILFVPAGGSTIFKVPAGGGKAEAVTHLQDDRGENGHYWPFVLPGARKFLYFVRSVRPENNGIYVAAMDGSGATRLVSSLSSGIYAPPLDGSPGHLLWVQNNELLAQPFDPDRAALSGEPATIAAGVRILEGPLGMLASVSRTGAIAWAPARGALRRFTPFDRDGRRRDPLPIEEGVLYHPTVSPDGGRLLYTRVGNGTADVFLHEFATGTSRRVTPGPDYDEQPLWSPDGAEMAHTSNRGGVFTVMRLRLDGSSPASELMREGEISATAWSPDHRYVVASKIVPAGGLDVMVLPAGDPKRITPLMTGPANETVEAFSPDGRWIAFVSDRSGRPEVYVARFHGEQSPPTIDNRVFPITSDGGAVLRGGWRRDGKEIVFLSIDGTLMAVPVDARDESVAVGRPVALFHPPVDENGVAMTPNADRFIATEYPFAEGQTLHVLTNWRERLSRPR